MHTPLYGGATKIPPAYGDRRGPTPAGSVPYAVDADAMSVSLDSAFWVFNLVSSVAYGERYAEAWPLIQARIHAIEGRLFDEVARMDAAAQSMLTHNRSSAAALAAITTFGVETAQALISEWRQFYFFLFARFRDGVTLTPGPRLCTSTDRTVGQACTYKVLPAVEEPGYSRAWYARIVRERGGHYRVPPRAMMNDDNGHQVAPEDYQHTPHEAELGAGDEERSIEVAMATAMQAESPSAALLEARLWQHELHKRWRMDKERCPKVKTAADHISEEAPGAVPTPSAALAVPLVASAALAVPLVASSALAVPLVASAAATTAAVTMVAAASAPTHALAGSAWIAPIREDAAARPREGPPARSMGWAAGGEGPGEAREAPTLTSATGGEQSSWRALAGAFACGAASTFVTMLAVQAWRGSGSHTRWVSELGSSAERELPDQERPFHLMDERRA